MNETIIKLGLKSGMLNYIDHETPRHYFLCGNADEECLENFVQLIVQECLGLLGPESAYNKRHINKHFGIEE